MIKKALIILLTALAIAAGFFYFYQKSKDKENVDFDKLVKNNKDLSTYVENIKKAQIELEKDKKNVESYLTLGLFWKSLADKTESLKIVDSKTYYQKALDIYKEGIEITQHKNTVFMVNAGNMAVNLKDYKAAEEFYKEAIAFAPGDATLYVKLAELYEYHMNKSAQEITALYDQGVEKVMNPSAINMKKEEYLQRNKK